MQTDVEEAFQGRALTNNIYGKVTTVQSERNHFVEPLCPSNEVVVENVCCPLRQQRVSCRVLVFTSCTLL